MSFSQTEKAQILKYLGYPVTFGFQDMVVTACAVVSNLGAETQVQETLRDLSSIEEQLKDSRLGAGRSFQSTSTGTAQYFRGDRLAELRSHGRQQVALLAQLMSLNVYRDVFTGGGGSGRVARG